MNSHKITTSLLSLLKPGQKHQNKTSAILLLTLILLVSCNSEHKSEPFSEPVFIHLGLDGKVVRDVYISGERIFAATDRGLYRKEQESDWEVLTNPEWDVYDFAEKDNKHFFVSYQFRGQPWLAESNDGGLTWENVQHNFGIKAPDQKGPSSEPLLKLLADDDALFATGYDALAVSYDNGKEWHKLAGVWNGLARGTYLLARDNANQYIWYGGQGAFENPVLRKYSESDSYYSDLVGIDEVLPVPSTVESIQFSTRNPQKVFVSGEGGIIFSDDYGETWHALHTNSSSRFYFDFAVFEDTSDTIYTAGWNKDFVSPQPLIVEVTRDSGKSWKTYQLDDEELFGGVYSLKVQRLQNKDTLYLGLFKGGVMQVDFLRNH